MRWHYKSKPAPAVPSLALINHFPGILAFTSLPLNRFRNKLTPNVPDNMLRNP